MTIDELVAKVDNGPAKPEPTAQEPEQTQTQAQPVEEDLLPIGTQFAEYCESRKRK